MWSFLLIKYYYNAIIVKIQKVDYHEEKQF
jgi:hypothetical protein